MSDLEDITAVFSSNNSDFQTSSVDDASTPPPCKLYSKLIY